MTDQALLEQAAPDVGSRPTTGPILGALSDRRLRVIGTGMVALMLTMAAVDITISIANGLWGDLIEVVLLGGVFGVVLVFAVRAEPRNRAIWAMVWAGFFGILAELGGSVAEAVAGLTTVAIENQEVFVSPASLGPLAALSISLAASVWVPGSFLLGIHLLVLFPAGDPPSRRWGWLLRAAGLSMAAIVVSGFVRTGPWVDTPYSELAGEPTGLLGWPSVLMVLLMAAALAAVVHLIVRYRRSAGEERLQYRWVMAALALYVLNIFAFGLFEDPVASLVSTATLVLIPTSFAIAIAKYRLYDIDVVISKSITYLGLAAVVTAVYGAIAAVPLLVLRATDVDYGPGGLALPFVATVIVAVLFEPLRVRMQRWANRLVYGDRATPHEVLSTVTAGLAQAGASGDDLAHLIAKGAGATSAVIWRTVGSQLVAEGSWPPGPTPEPISPGQLSQYDAQAGVVHLDETLGAVTINKDRSDPVSPADQDLLQNVAAAAGLMLRNSQLYRQLEERAVEVRQSRHRLIAARDAERRRLERDLHDGAQQQVVALKVKLGLAKTLAEREGADELALTIASLSDETQEAVDAMRRVAHGIYPPLLEAEGLAAALRALRRTAPVSVTVGNGDLGRYDRRIEQSAYFFVSESVDRAHMAGARNVHVAIDETDGLLGITLDHDGRVTVADVGAFADRIEAFGGTATTEVGVSGRSRTVVAIPATDWSRS